MTGFYLGIEDENGLHILRRLSDDHGKAIAEVNQMNEDMSTKAYSVVGDRGKEDVFELPDNHAEIFKFTVGGTLYKGVIGNLEISQTKFAQNEIELEIRGFAQS